MAGGGFLSSMFTTMVAKLHSLALPSTSSSSSLPHNNIEQKMSKLTETMRRIQARLADSEEENPVTSHSVKLWLSELKDVAYDAEDAVEEYEYEVLRSKQLHVARESDLGTEKVRDSSVIAFVDTATVYELANKAAEIKKRFDEITKEWNLLMLPKKAGKRKRKRNPSPLDKNRETGSLVVESDVLGREEEKDMLVEWLLSEDDTDTAENRVSVIAVIGMGGLGKTTLAQLVYNDPRVKSYFDFRGWVCVSENFHVVNLTEKILQSFTKEKVHPELDGLQHALRENLQGKKFLLILDDVWNEEFTLWDELRKPLVSAKVGKVIVTTRNQPVARIMETRRPLDLNCLPFHVCWSLFKKVALGGADKTLRPDLEDIGRKIVEKCKGLPLAAKLIGGALRNEEDEDSWTDIIESEIWELGERTIEVLPALKISYDCMPIQLKRCFQYLSLFPKDVPLCSKEIVRLWLSQGLLPLDGNKRAEDVGRNYIRRLAERSIIYQKWSSFFMHDLVRDLAQYVAQDECLCVMDNKLDTKKLQKIRHLMVNVERDEGNIKDLPPLKLLRSFFIRRPLESYWRLSIARRDKTFEVFDDLFQKFKCIRTLDLSHSHITRLPDSLGNLKLLRYLSIANTEVESFPEFICNFYNLQTLDLSYSSITELPHSLGNLKLLRYLSIENTAIKSLPESICSLYDLQTLDMQYTNIRELPRQIGNLINLRHLLLPYQVAFLPSGIGNLTDLKTLTFFKVSREKEHCHIGEFSSLMKLRGQISIRNIRDMNECSNSEPPLMIKRYLDSLTLFWGSDRLDSFYSSKLDEEKAEWQLEYLHPHVNLKTLQIHEYPGEKFAGWVGDLSFTKLTSLSLFGCRNCSKLPPLGQLPALQDLEIVNMDGVRHVGREFCSTPTPSPSSSQNRNAFLSLKHLLFSNMKNWEVWDEVETGDFPKVHNIRILDCPELIQRPQLPEMHLWKARTSCTKCLFMLS